MLWTLLAILIILWLLGAVTNAVGGLIHLILVVAAIVVVYQLVAGRRTA